MYVCMYVRFLVSPKTAGSVNVSTGGDGDDKQIELRFRVLSAIQNIFYDHDSNAQNNLSDSLEDVEGNHHHKPHHHVAYNTKVG